ncbi:uncharacterized protein LOC117778266 [Hippoglossus hippoglossus]|uniref:uncharacterized protein LOC117778266 n=1 Tax=Hippoglossus hippoglossus TaxID=8267 RepID=UPI00148D1385|nr:uncharacterized protein LOC117778266 [Hippoglossus hippoglossus]
MDQAAKLPSTLQLGDAHRLCTCGNKISSMDTHQVCSACLGLEHAHAAISNAGSCADCARFTAKSLRRRLARQASLSERDPILSSATTEEPQPGVDEEDTPKPEIQRWGSTLDLLNPLTEPPLMLDYDEEDESDGEDCLVSDGDDKDYESSFVPTAQALSSPSPAKGLGEAITPQPSGDMHDVCKRAAERLQIPWPAVVAEAPRSHYEGKKLPQAKRAARQPGVPGAPGGSYHLMEAKPLLQQNIADVPECSAWDEITTIADICLRVQRCAVQAAGKCMSMLVLQERTRWLNLTNLSDREKDDILDMPIVPDGVFGSALASMQKRCEAKKKEDEALQLCLPRKTPAAAQPPPGRLSLRLPLGVPPLLSASRSATGLSYRVRAPTAPRTPSPLGLKSPSIPRQPRLLNRARSPVSRPGGRRRRLSSPPHRERMCQPFPVPWQSSYPAC